MAKKLSDTFDKELVKKLASLLDETGLTEIEYEYENSKIRVVRSQSNSIETINNQSPIELKIPTGGGANTNPNGMVEADRDPGTVTAPMVGIVYTSSDPDSKPFVQIGDKVVENQTILLIEAMKVFNQIKAPKSGKVVQLLVDNGSPVEFGEPLLIIG